MKYQHAAIFIFGVIDSSNLDTEPYRHKKGAFVACMCVSKETGSTNHAPFKPH